jgi:hypothetical protein
MRSSAAECRYEPARTWVVLLMDCSVLPADACTAGPPFSQLALRGCEERSCFWLRDCTTVRSGPAHSSPALTRQDRVDHWRALAAEALARAADATDPQAAVGTHQGHAARSRRAHRIDIVDYSPYGPRLERASGIEPDERVTVQLRSGLRLPMRVVWVVGSTAALRFLGPIAPGHNAMRSLDEAARGHQARRPSAASI